ncbi:MAG: YgjV family protein [Christensenellaceae bacterium]|jgi:hypothetical protein|nr:YgjV family protein [Christensenellaceae bacterium]
MGDWGNPVYIISQVFVILSYGFLVATYFVKKRSPQLLITISANAAMVVGYLLLSAWVGMGMASVAICRDITSEVLHKKRNEQDKNKITKLDWFLLPFWLTVLTIITIFTENGILTWFALFATATFTISIWQKNKIVYNALGILVGIFWVIYNFNAENLFGVILESALFVAVIIGLIVSIKQRKIKR